ncbi:MAG: PadR family transcriptional regulator [Rhodothermales bacterium]
MLPKPLVAASVRPIILTLLADQAMYGYEIIQRVRTISDGQIQWTPGKLYPLLHGLENQGLIEAFWRPSEEGPDRKYYRLTERGALALAGEKQSWLDLNAILVRLWGPDVHLQPAR